MEKTREQIAEELRKEGYNITLENGVMIIHTDDPDMTQDAYHALLLKKGYDCSYGMRLSGAAASAYFERISSNSHKEHKPAAPKPENRKPEEKMVFHPSKSSSKNAIAGQISLF